jgi:H+/Cl- antiporter ClcA
LATPLFIDRPWYRELLVVSAIVGLVGGLLGIAYLGSTNAISDVVFGAPRTTAWSGDWWWIPVTALGGVVVAALRRWWRVPEHVPGGVAVIESGIVDHRVAPSWVALAFVSAAAGASLGPSFALVIMGGGLASWISSRRWHGNEDARLEATIAGIAGVFGGAFTAPVVAPVLVTELAPTAKPRYVESILPQLIAAMVAFVLFFQVSGPTLLDNFAIPVPEFTPWQLVIGVVLGAASSLVLLAFVVVVRSVNWLGARISNGYVRGLVGGAMVGLIAVALPLTLGSGNSQLTAVIEHSATMGVGLLLATLVGKMVAMALSLSAGFIGGNVLPMFFVGGTAGAVVHLVFPDIPYAIAVGCMLAAVPGAYIKAPVGFTLLAALTVGFGPVTAAPVAAAVATSYLLTMAILSLVRTRVAETPIHA